MLPGKIAFLLIVATALSFFGALIVAARYRATMQALMRAPVALPTGAVPAAPRPLPYTADSPAAPVSLADNRQAQRRLILGFLGLTLLMALTRTLLMQIVSDGPITLKTVTTLCAAYAWPVVPVVAVLRRWPRWRFVGTLLLWFVAAVILLSWRTNENISFGQVLFWLSLDIGLPLIVVSALCLGSATRAVAPWLAPLFVLLCWASQAGVDLLAALVEAQSPLAYWLASHIGATTAIALFALFPWLFAWWPARAIGRGLADAYAARRISELFYLFTAVWVIALVGPALGAIASEGWGALLYFLPLAWIPLAGWLLRMGTERQPGGRPPTLLVLRVFQQDANVQDLFDRVIERWRLTGNTVLIAGTDLVDRTIDAEDIFTFLDGRLVERFIRHPEEIGQRLGAFEWQPDVEGRYRVNECYCHDSTWQQTLSATPDLKRVIVLGNERTELAPAQAATAGAPAGRFVWLMQRGSMPPATEAVLAPLLDSDVA